MWLSSRELALAGPGFHPQHHKKKEAMKVKKKDIDLSYDPAIPLLGIYPKECDSGYSKGICTPMFIAALFTIAKL
jgi:hypothetical protein